MSEFEPGVPDPEEVQPEEPKADEVEVSEIEPTDSQAEAPLIPRVEELTFGFPVIKRLDGSYHLYSQKLTPEQVNSLNEADEINKMVDEGILTREEAAHFDYDQEIESTSHLIKDRPKISEQLRQQIISKFPQESFVPENAYGHDIHGTSFDAIYPIWKATGQARTGEYGRYYNPAMGGYRHPFQSSQASTTKGIFHIHGMADFIGKHDGKEAGFGPDPKTGRRNLTEARAPINIIGPKTYKDEAWYLNPRAIVLALREENSIENKIILLEEIKNKTQQLESDFSRHVPNYIFKDLVSTAKGILVNPTTRDEYLRKILANFKLTPEEEEDLKYPYNSTDLAYDRELGRKLYKAQDKVRGKESLTEAINNASSSERDIIDKAELGLARVIFNYLEHELSQDEVLDYIQKHIEYLSELPARREGRLYDWAKSGSDRERIFTAQEVANYAANTMVQGVDKSKIVPVYDWDGNLLWPKETDIKTNEDYENEEAIPETS